MTDLLVLAGAAVDLYLRRRIHAGYLWGGGMIIGTQVATDLLAPTTATLSVLKLLGSAS